MLQPDLPLSLTFDDVLLLPARSEVLPADAVVGTELAPGLELEIPMLSSAMDTVTEASMAIAMARAGGLGVIHRNLTPEQQADAVRVVKQADGGALKAGAAMGSGEAHLERGKLLVEAGCDLIVVDTAHGHSTKVLDTVRRLRELAPHTAILAGNVVTADATLALIEAGASAVKVGVGPGSICTTRVVAGVGMPQITAVADCATAAAPLGIPIVADGGLRTSGDMVKALAAGAHAVMVGSLLAGTDESPGEVIEREGRRFKQYRGMGSLGAMMQGSSDRYFQGGVAADKLVPEGVEAQVPYRGPVHVVLHQLVGGLRAGMGYTGSATLAELRERAEFVRISPAGLLESRVHDVLTGAV